MDEDQETIEIICPCGYSFEGVLGEDDGEFVCPECARIVVLPGSGHAASESAKDETHGGVPPTGEVSDREPGTPSKDESPSRKGKTTVQARGAVPLIQTGEAVGPYKITRVIGEGGMGRVFRGLDTSLHRDVAIKILSQQLLDKRDFVIRFEREARAIARLNHPNIVQIYFTGVHRGLPYYAMELVSGGSLEDLKSGEGLDPYEALKLMIQAAEGLHAASLENVIHRDIKPSNLMRDKSGRLKIADFGLAKTVAIDSAITHTGTIIGTPYYMAPEQGEGRAIDLRADIYSLGASFYHLLGGAPPFEADSPIGVIIKHLKEDAKPLRTRNPNVPESLARIIERMMAKSPEDRYGDYPELLRDLRAARDGREVKAAAFPKSEGQEKNSASVRKDRKRSYVVKDSRDLEAEEDVVLARCGLFRRLASFAVDYAILFFPFWIYDRGYGLVQDHGDPDERLVWRALFLVATLLYFFLGDGRGGMTLGKILFRCRVGRRDGENIGFASSLLRTVVFFPMLLAPGILPETVGLGDFFRSYYLAVDSILGGMDFPDTAFFLAQISSVMLFISLGFMLVTPRRIGLHDVVSGAFVFAIDRDAHVLSNEGRGLSNEGRPAQAGAGRIGQDGAPPRRGGADGGEGSRTGPAPHPGERTKAGVPTAHRPPPIPRDAMTAHHPGTRLGPGPRGLAQGRIPAYLGRRKNPLLAMLLSCIPGVGQFYNGDVVKGFLILFTCWLVLPWVLGIFDAFFRARQINRRNAYLMGTLNGGPGPVTGPPRMRGTGFLR